MMMENSAMCTLCVNEIENIPMIIKMPTNFQWWTVVCLKLVMHKLVKYSAHRNMQTIGRRRQRRHYGYTHNTLIELK